MARISHSFTDETRSRGLLFRFTPCGAGLSGQADTGGRFPVSFSLAIAADRFHTWTTCWGTRFAGHSELPGTVNHRFSFCHCGRFGAGRGA